MIDRLGHQQYTAIYGSICAVHRNHQPSLEDSMVQYGYRRARNKYTFKFKLTNGHQHYDTSHTRTTTISGIPMVLMPKVIGMEALSENSITSKTLQPIKGPDKQTTQKARPRGNVLQRPETPSPQSGKKRMQPDTMTTPTAPRHKKTQQTHQEEILLPPVILNVKEGFQRFIIQA